MKPSIRRCVRAKPGRWYAATAVAVLVVFWCATAGATSTDRAPANTPAAVEVPLTLDGTPRILSVAAGVTSHDAAAQFCRTVRESAVGCVSTLAAEIAAVRRGGRVARFNESGFARLLTAVAVSHGGQDSTPAPFTVLQVGAHVGNTPNDPVFRHLAPATSGWRGLLVEPVHALFLALRANYHNASPQPPLAFDARVRFANVAVCASPGRVPFYFVDDPGPRSSAPDASQLGSLDRATVERGAVLSGLPVLSTTVSCLPVADLLAANGVAAAEVSYLQVDCEGRDWDVVRSAVVDAGTRPLVLRLEWKHLPDAVAAHALDVLEGREPVAKVDGGRQLQRVGGNVDKGAALGTGVKDAGDDRRLDYRCWPLGASDMVCVRGMALTEVPRSLTGTDTATSAMT